MALINPAVSRATNPLLLPKIRSNLIMNTAQDMPCNLRISSLYPGHTCRENGTTVGCHAPVFGSGQSTKATDLAVIYGCYNCHEIIDRRQLEIWHWLVKNRRAELWERIANGIIETQSRLAAEAIIFVRDGKIII